MESPQITHVSPPTPALPFPTVLSTAPDQDVAVGPDAPIMEVLRTTRAMRRIKPDPVPRELLERVVEAATWAPSAGNAQRYSYIIVTDPVQVARLAPLWRQVQSKYLDIARCLVPAAFGDPAAAASTRATEYLAEHFERTPAVVAVCYEDPPISVNANVLADLVRAVGPRFLFRALSPRTLTLARAGSAYPGVQNLLLAARAHGLAATMSSWHLLAESEFKAVLGVPKRVTIYALVPIGWPAGRFGPVRRRPLADVVRWDHW